MPDTDARQWTLTHNAHLALPSGIVKGQLDRALGIVRGSEVTGPHTGDERVTVVPISRLDEARAEQVPDHEAAQGQRRSGRTAQVGCSGELQPPGREPKAQGQRRSAGPRRVSGASDRGLRLVDPDGEVVERKYTYEDLVALNQKKDDKYSGALLQISNLEKELAGARGKEPDSKEVREVLEFYRDLSGRRRIAIDPSSERWAKARARLRQKCDPRITVDRLKAALVGAPKADWFKDQAERQDPLVVFGKAEFVEKCEAAAGKPSKPMKVSNLSPLEAARLTLVREFGFDAVEDFHAPETGVLEEIWAVCPLHPSAYMRRPMRVIERGARGSIHPACVEGCDHDDIYEALRVLYAMQSTRDVGGEIAALRTQVAELSFKVEVYERRPGKWAKDAVEDLAQLPQTTDGRTEAA